MHSYLIHTFRDDLLFALVDNDSPERMLWIRLSQFDCVAQVRFIVHGQSCEAGFSVACFADGNVRCSIAPPATKRPICVASRTDVRRRGSVWKGVGVSLNQFQAS
jgi:hypothetical protein